MSGGTGCGVGATAVGGTAAGAVPVGCATDPGPSPDVGAGGAGVAPGTVGVAGEDEPADDADAVFGAFVPRWRFLLRDVNST